MTNSDFAIARGQQAVGLLLSTLPIAERLLLYNLASTAWILLADPTWLQSSLHSCTNRLRRFRQSPIRQLPPFSLPPFTLPKG